MLIPLLFGVGLIAAAYAGAKAVARENAQKPTRALPPAKPPAANRPAAARPPAKPAAPRPDSPAGRAQGAAQTAQMAARQAAGAVTEAQKRGTAALSQIAQIAKKAAVGEASVPECVAGLAWHAGRPGFSSATSPFYKGLSKKVGEVKADQVLSRIRARRAFAKARG